jgi:hypothetical protein
MRLQILLLCSFFCILLQGHSSRTLIAEFSWQKSVTYSEPQK